jgi:hypothetical protein
LSGWYSLMRARYAAWISSAEAVAGMPRTSWGSLGVSGAACLGSAPARWRSRSRGPRDRAAGQGRGSRARRATGAGSSAPSRQVYATLRTDQPLEGSTMAAKTKPRSEAPIGSIVQQGDDYYVRLDEHPIRVNDLGIPPRAPDRSGLDITPHTRTSGPNAAWMPYPTPSYGAERSFFRISSGRATKRRATALEPARWAAAGASTCCPSIWATAWGPTSRGAPTCRTRRSPSTT